MKKLLALLLCLLMAMTTVTAFAAPYQQHLSNEATFDTLENARAKECDEMAVLTPGRSYMPDPALDTYPEGTTWVYRSAGIYTPLSAAPRMNTNFLVYVDKEFADDAEALAYIQELGLTDLADQAFGSVVLVTPVNPATGFAQADQYAFFLLQAAMTNIGGSTGGSPATYYADNCYYGGLTYRYVIGIDGGATFINQFIATTLDDISRVAGLLLFGGKMADVYNVVGRVPAYLVNVPERVVAKYSAANEVDAYGEDGDVKIYFNQARPQQAVRVAQWDALTAENVKEAYYSFLSKAMRVPVLKAGVNNGNMLFADYSWNQAPYTLSVRVPIFDGRTADGLILSEFTSAQFAADGETESTWYELVPEEVINGTVPDHSVVLWLSNHGGGDDTIQYMDEIGLIELASKERIAVIGGQNLATPAMAQYMLDKYPALDPSRVYTFGYSAGGGNTLGVIYENPGLFAAAVPMAAVNRVPTDEQRANFDSVDLPTLFLTSTYDYFFDSETFDWRVSGMCDYPQNLKDFFAFNGLTPVEEYDMETYPLHGFKHDSYRRITLNGEYTNHTWLVNNEAGIPIVGLTVTEFLPHGLYPEYSKIAWDFCKHYRRNVETGEVIYNPYAD